MSPCYGRADGSSSDGKAGNIFFGCIGRMPRRIRRDAPPMHQKGSEAPYHSGCTTACTILHRTTERTSRGIFQHRGAQPPLAAYSAAWRHQMHSGSISSNKPGSASSGAQRSSTARHLVVHGSSGTGRPIIHPPARLPILCHAAAGVGHAPQSSPQQQGHHGAAGHLPLPLRAGRATPTWTRSSSTRRLSALSTAADGQHETVPSSPSRGAEPPDLPIPAAQQMGPQAPWRGTRCTRTSARRSSQDGVPCPELRHARDCTVVQRQRSPLPTSAKN
jgi:hypothetical protein